LGLSMAEHFAGVGADVKILSRAKPHADDRWSHHFWDGRTLGDWTAVLDGADAVVNLAGRTVNCIKT
jgi:NAD dependent epimerase/dehydratase family enzyme